MSRSLKILRKIARPHWFEIIELVKCSGGLSVGELAEAMSMSYMGVKKHCVAMQKLGYLDTWRRPKEVGRPEKLYRVTERLNAIFPSVGENLVFALLEDADHIEPNAAEKLLFAYFRRTGEELASRVLGDSVQERAERLAEARYERGHYSRCMHSEEEGLRIEEFHNPLQALFEKYPTMERMETQMFERLLSARVLRSVKKSSGLVRYRFDLAPLRSAVRN